VKKKDIFLPLASFLLCVGLLSAFASKSYAATTPKSSLSASSAQCRVAQVTLHGTAASTMQCLHTWTSTGAIVPNSTIDNLCLADSLVLYYNGPWGSQAANNGPILCIKNAGVFDMRVTVDGVQWNDAASAWWTGCLNTIFYVNTPPLTAPYAEEPGSNYGLSSPHGNFPLNTGDETVGNDQLSYVDMYASNWSC
jgi:hypothetical protein